MTSGDWGIWDVTRRQWLPDPLKGHIDMSPARYKSKSEAERAADREWRPLNPDTRFEVRPMRHEPKMKETAHRCGYRVNYGNGQVSNTFAHLKGARWELAQANKENNFAFMQFRDCSTGEWFRLKGGVRERSAEAADRHPDGQVRIEHAVVRYKGGWIPFAWDNDRPLSNLYGPPLDRDEAASRARATAEDEASHYGGDWDIQIVDIGELTEDQAIKKSRSHRHRPSETRESGSEREVAGEYHTRSGKIGLIIYRHTYPHGVTYSYTGKWGAGSGHNAAHVHDMLRNLLARTRGVQVIIPFREPQIREAHVVADFNTLDDLIAHAERELGATHVLVAGAQTRIFFQRGGGYPYEEAKVWRKGGYWHAEGPGARAGIRQLPRDAETIGSYLAGFRPGHAAEARPRASRAPTMTPESIMRIASDLSRKVGGGAPVAKNPYDPSMPGALFETYSPEHNQPVFQARRSR